MVASTVRLGGEGDTKELTSRVLAAGTTLARVCDDPRQEQVLRSFTADEGYFSVEETRSLQGERIRTIIGDHYASQRRAENQSAIDNQVLHKARRAVKGASGKALLRRRGDFIERSFTHVLGKGGPRRTTLLEETASHQTETRRGARIRPVTADAQANRLRHAQTMAGRRPRRFSCSDRVADESPVAA